MKSNLLFILFIIFLGGSGVYIFKNNSSPEIAKDRMVKEVMVPKTSVNSEEKMAIDKKDDRYVDFSTEILNETKDTRRVLFFNANWCPTCKSARESFTENISKIPSDVTIIVVSYNDDDVTKEEKELAKKYGITYQHTFVQIDDQGSEISKWNGGEINELLSNLK